MTAGQLDPSAGPLSNYLALLLQKRGEHNLHAPPLFLLTKCLHVRHPLHLPPSLSLSLSLWSPSSPISPSLHNWIMGGKGGSIVHCFGFPWFKSSSQSGQEGTRGASRNLWAVKGVVEAVNGLGTQRGPRWCDGMKYNKPEFTHPKLKEVVLFKGWNSHYEFSTSLQNVFVHLGACVCACVCEWCYKWENKGKACLIWA